MEQHPYDTTIYSLSDVPPADRDRRDDERHLTLFRVGALMIDDRRELCLIKNISAGGMLIRAYCPIPSGARLSVELKCGDPVAGKAIWARGETVGIAFDRPIDVVELLTASMEGPRPRMPRIEVSSVAWLRHGAIVHRVQACDVSQGGIKVACDSQFDINDDVTITLPGLEPQPGIVCWRHEDAYGITFNRVVPLPLLVGWIQEQRERLRAAG